MPCILQQGNFCFLPVRTMLRPKVWRRAGAVSRSLIVWGSWYVDSSADFQQVSVDGTACAFTRFTHFLNVIVKDKRAFWCVSGVDSWLHFREQNNVHVKKHPSTNRFEPFAHVYLATSVCKSAHPNCAGQRVACYLRGWRWFSVVLLWN